MSKAQSANVIRDDLVVRVERTQTGYLVTPKAINSEHLVRLRRLLLRF